MTTITKENLLNDLNAVVGETEQLMKSIATAGGEKAHALRASVEENLKIARDRLVQLEKAAVEKARETAKTTDAYVHANPWQSIAIAAAVSAIVGIVIGLLLNRR